MKNRGRDVVRERGGRQIDMRFRQGDSVGRVAAEHDAMLRDAFQDPAGYLGILMDTEDSRCIVVGRTGSGKTALLKRLRGTAEHAVEVNPLSVTIDYLQHETALPQIIDNGVNFDPFFRFLWKHVLTLEILRGWQLAKGETTLQGVKVLIQRKMALNSKWKRLDEALKYIEDWGGGQFASIEERSKTIIKKFDQQLAVEGGISWTGVKGGVTVKDGGEKRPAISPDKHSRIQRLVSHLSNEKINTLVEFLQDQVLTDPLKPHFILIDQLDTAWVDSMYAYDLTDALIHVAGEFAMIPNVKIIVALRQDIVESLRTQDRKRQWEKYVDLFLPLQWTPHHLEELMDARLQLLLRDRYRAGPVLLATLLPPRERRGIMAVDYLIDRTLLRPRDLIQFVNHCINEAVALGRHSVGWDQIDAAELPYSNERVQALVDEWDTVHPGLRIVLEAFRGVRGTFTIDDLDDNRLAPILEAGEKMAAAHKGGPIPVPMAVFGLIEGDFKAMWQLLVDTLYDVGFLGIKPHAGDLYSYAFDGPGAVQRPFPDGAKFVVHPMFTRSLGIDATAPTIPEDEKGAPEGRPKK